MLYYPESSCVYSRRAVMTVVLDLDVDRVGIVHSITLRAVGETKYGFVMG